MASFIPRAILLGTALAAARCAPKAPPTAAAADASTAPATATVSEVPAVSAAPAAPADAGRDLVFVGTITAIGAAPVSGTTVNFIVTTRVDRVVSGEFGGKTFQFGIHSPSKSGLTVGGEYTVKALWMGDGYSVDQYQWRRGR